MKLILHIGTPKTASTYLQNTCAANPEWLARNGILYPDLKAWDANHITLFFAAARGAHDFAKDYGLRNREDLERFRAELSDLIARQVAEAPPSIHTMLMSSENLAGNLRTVEELKTLHSFLSPHFESIKIIVYLRRQDDALLSMYGEFMRRGFSKATFHEFVTRALGPETTTPYLYYRRLLNQWILAFGQEVITVRLFDRDRMHGGDVLVDFLTEVTGAPVDLEGLTPSENDNTGLSAPVLEFLRLMHPHIPFRKDNQLNQQRVGLSRKINALPAKPRPRMADHQSRRIMTQFLPANTWLRDTFFPDHDGPLFPMRDDTANHGNLGQVTLEEFASFTAGLLP